LQWFKQTFAPNESFDNLLQGISEISAGSDGLLFTPYLVGERTPYPDSKIRGSFIGIDTKHTIKHFAKAVIEGITFSLKDSQELMRTYSGKNFVKIISVGGGAKNKDWLQVQANIFGVPIAVMKSEQGPSLGAAMLAAVGVGWFASVSECAKCFVALSEEFQPQPEQVLLYEKIYSLYKKVYPSTAPICSELAEVRQQ